MIKKNKRIGNDSLGIQVEESEKRIIKNPQNVVFMDKIIFPNGNVFYVNKIENGNITLSCKVTITKEELPTFMKGAEIERADCFENGEFTV